MPDTTNSPEDILGIWRLNYYTISTSYGKSIRLWGERADGVIIYLPNGYMSVHVSDTDRPKFVANDVLGGTFDELKSAFEGYTSYFGTYEYKPDEKVVLHYVLQSVFPNWSGITQKRFAFIQNNKLLIKTPPISIKGENCIMELLWNRL